MLFGGVTIKLAILPLAVNALLLANQKGLLYCPMMHLCIGRVKLIREQIVLTCFLFEKNLLLVVINRIVRYVK